ncbi:hypothetical protein Agub_g14279, partial [Astrephomene gubernaculifera]
GDFSDTSRTRPPDHPPGRLRRSRTRRLLPRRRQPPQASGNAPATTNRPTKCAAHSLSKRPFRQVQRLFPSEGRPPAHYLATAQRIAGFVRQHLWLDGRLRRSYCRGQPSAVQG